MMRKNQTKIRVIAEDPRVLKIFESIIQPMAKKWGKRTLMRRKYHTRDPDHDVYSSTFGTARYVGYYRITVDPELLKILDEKEPLHKFLETPKPTAEQCEKSCLISDLKTTYDE